MVFPTRSGNLCFVTLPLVKLSGSSFQQGVQHGEALHDRIAHNLDVYFDRFHKEAKLERPDVLMWASRMSETIRDRSPEYFEGMRGIAQGSGFDFLEIVALNVRYEILYFQFGEVGLAQQGQTRASFGKPDGCTLFAVAPDASANGHVLMGQAWDWIPQVKGAVLHTVHEDGLETLTFTEAGIFGGKIGLNSEGVGLCISGLTSMDDDWSRAVRPVHVRCYEILRSRTFEDAMRVVTDEERACSTNFLIGQAPDSILDLEAAPNGVMQLLCVNGTLAHANHFVNPEALGIAETPMDLRTHSYSRAARMTELLDQRKPHTIHGLQEIMRDRHGFPDSISFHPNPDDPPEERYMTVTAAVMDLETREVWFSDGPPDQNPFDYHKLEG